MLRPRLVSRVLGLRESLPAVVRGSLYLEYLYEHVLDPDWLLFFQESRAWGRE